MPNLPFLISNKPYGIIISNDKDGNTISIKISLDIISIRDGIPEVNNSPKFEVNFKISAAIKPISSKNALTPLPLLFPSNFKVMAKSSINEKTYEMPFEVKVLSIDISEKIDLITEMPDVTTQIFIQPLAICHLEHEDSTTFECIYCGLVHDRIFHSKEHIIPESLFNNNYTLSNICKEKNNYMANAFETRVMTFDIMKEISLMFAPPKKATHRGEIDTPLGKISRWILPSGKTELAKTQEYLKTNRIQISLKGRTGEIFLYDLKLPFTIIDSVSGTPRTTKARHRHIKQAKEKISTYLKELASDPSIHQDFENFLKQIDSKFIYNEVIIEEKKLPDQPITEVLNDITQTSIIDNELFYKLLLKIAWTYAAKELGAENLKGNLGKWILNYLIHNHIEDKELIKNSSELLTKPYIIEGKEYVFWKYNLSETLSLIEKIADKSLKKDLLRAYKYRLLQFEFAKQLIINNVSMTEINEELRARSAQLRFHNLKLEPFKIQNKSVTVCHIQLFGGILDFKIQLSEEPLIENYPMNTRINF